MSMICEVIPEDDFHVRCKHCGTQYQVGANIGNCSAQKEELPPEVKPEIEVKTEPVTVKNIVVKTRPIVDTIIKDVTFCITSFERPQHLQRLLESIQKYYPEAKVLVADYSNVHPKITFGKMLELEFDTGLSAARNVLAQACTTKYLLMLEEDFVFTKETKIEPMMDILECDKFLEIGVVGGCITVNNEKHWFDLNLRRYRNKIHGEKSPNIFQATKNGTYYKYCDMVFNFSLWRIDVLRDNPFPPELKVGEHIIYYWLLKNKGQWRVVFTTESSIGHDTSGRTDNYQTYRFRANRLQNAWLNKNGLTGYVQQKDIYSLPNKYTNVVVLGVGHSGTSILSKMLMSCGLNKNDNDKEFGESVSVREINDKIAYNIYSELDNVSLKTYSQQDQVRVLETLLEPWVLKDPRFVHTLDKWAHLFSDNPPLLIWIQRKTEDVLESYYNRNSITSDEQVYTLYQLAKDQYDRWPWRKMIIKYEDIAQAVQMFQVVRKPEIKQLELFQ